MEQKEHRRAAAIILIAWLAYMISYVGRSDYSACVLEIVNATGANRTTAGMVASVFSLCNALGQLVSGFIMKKISALKVIAAELCIVCVINFLFPITDSFLVMAVLWGINGTLQSTLLCGITQIFAHNLKEPYLSRGMVLMNTIGAAGGFFNYILSFILIRFFSWKCVFFSVSVMLAAVASLWIAVMPKLAKMPLTEPAAPIGVKPASQTSLYIIFCRHGTIYVIVAAFFIGGLRESVSLWIPSYMNEVFFLGSDVATVITAVVPCLQVCGALLGGVFGRRSRVLQYPACIAFFLSAFCLMMIRILGNFSLIITIGLFVVNAISMTAALTFLLSLFPVRHVKSGNVAVLVGIINFSVHSGDFFASTGIGWLSAFGWNSAFLILCFAAAMGGIVCLLGGFSCLREEKKNGKERISI